MTAHIVEVGPSAIRRLCCGGDAVVDSEAERVALESIDDPVTLVDLRPVAVESLWRTVLAVGGLRHRRNCDRRSPIVVGTGARRSGQCGRAGSRRRRCDATAVVAADVKHLRPNAGTRPLLWKSLTVSWLSPAPQWSPKPAVETSSVSLKRSCVPSSRWRRTRPRRWSIDAPSTVHGAGALAAMIAEGLRDSRWYDSRCKSTTIGLRKLATAIVPGESNACDSNCADAARPDHRRRWTLALVATADQRSAWSERIEPSRRTRARWHADNVV